jgi:ribosomal-protein-alanine N-acetyltransferase
MADADARIADTTAGVRENTAISWGITLRDGGALAGTAGLWRWNQPHRWAEIGYDLLPEHWGRGLMTEALRPILRFGFEAMDLHRIEANIDPDNRASRRVLERLGFVREAHLRENWLYDGRFTDSAIYGLLRREFMHAQASP